MPNVFHLWKHGVKFERYYSAGNACSPARATLATGPLPPPGMAAGHADQDGPVAAADAFPTYGKLLQAHRATRRHISASGICRTRRRRSVDGYLANYGFTD